jgi:regulator of RNase E activity RraB
MERIKMSNYTPYIDEDSVDVWVDLTLKESAPHFDKPWMFILFFEQPATFELAPVHTKLLEGFSKATLLSGFRKNGEWLELFFYTDEKRGLEKHSAQTLKSFGISAYDTHISQDKGWKTYKEMLFPNDQEMFQIENRLIIEAMTQEGLDLTQHYDVEFFALFKDDESAKAFTNGLSDECYVEFFDNDQGFELVKGVMFIQTMVIDKEKMDQLSEHYFELAREHNGVFDGWEIDAQ